MNINFQTSLGTALAALTLAGCQSYSPTATTWETLFNGASIEQARQNFRGYKQDGFPGGWAIDDVALKTLPGASGADIITRQMYANFELEFEWAVSAGGNGGVMYGVAEAGDEAWNTGPEYQVLDDARHSDGKNLLTSAGALYALIAPNVEKMTLTVGKFNQGRIIVDHGHVEHWLNGHRIVEYKWDSAPLQALIAQSKFAALPRFMKVNNGHIVFQHHGQEVWYRNIRVRRL